MRISFSPRAVLPGVSTVMAVTATGDVLTVNGDVLDFSGLPDGATLPAGAVDCEWIVGPVERIAGEIHLTLLLPHGPAPSAAVAFPEPIMVTVDGPVDVPFDPEPEPAPIPEEA
ncbi:MAG: hypothetical protein ACTHOP_02370 [Mesorhizobium sp.]